MKLILLSSLLFPFLLLGQTATPKKPLTGAIYWGMYDSYNFGAPAQVEVTLNPDKYRYRVPFFGRESTPKVISYNSPPGETRETATTSLRINADKQWVIDQEIKYAVDAGIDYFAYLYYGKNHYSHRLFKSSTIPERQKLKMCWITGTLADTEIPHVIKDMGADYYQKVLDGRPIFYYLKINEDCNAVGNFLHRFRSEYRKIHPALKDPYIVVMDNGTHLGAYCNNGTIQIADAFSSYGSGNGGGNKDHTYDYVKNAEINGWAKGDLSKGGQKRVLWMSLGTDRRPRVDFPVSWERTPEGKEDPGNSINWGINPSNAEVTDQLQRAVNFINTHPETCETNSLLIYAWNEHDEGGWISPTIVPGKNEINREKLLTVKKILNPSGCQTLLKTPLLSHTTPLKIKEGDSVTLTANCEEGTPLWSNGFSGNNLRFSDKTNTTYHVKCIKDQCTSNELFIDVVIEKECEITPFSAELFEMRPEKAPRPKFGSNFDGNDMVSNGVNFTQAYKGGLGSEAGTELTFDLGLDHGYGFLTGVVSLDDSSPCKNSEVTFYLRDLISMDFYYTSPKIFFDANGKSNLDTFKIDIRNVRYLRMDTHPEQGQQNCIKVNWGMLKLECPPDCEADIPPVLTADKPVIMEGESVKISGTCQSGNLVWPDGSTESFKVFSPKRNTSYTAICKTFGCDGSLTAKPLEVSVTVNCEIPHHIDYFKMVSKDDTSRIKIGKNALGNPITTLDSNGNIVVHERGFGIKGPLDIHFDLTEKRTFKYFKVTVAIDPADTCSLPVKFRVMEMADKRDMFTTPLIYPIGKGTPNSYDIEIPLEWMLWFNMQVVPTGTDSCGLYNWIDPRYECYSDIMEDPVLGNEERDSELSLYPNPSSGSFTVTSKNLPKGKNDILIFDILGREVYRKEMDLEAPLKESEVLIQGLSSGKYLLQLKNERGTSFRHIVTY